MNNEIRKIVHTYGIEYICEKREKKNIILFIIVTFSLYYIYYLYLGYKKGIFIINEVQIFIFCFYILLIITYLNNYSIEKLFLINNVGIQIEKISWLQHSLKFICLNDVKRIFINEVIYIFEICPKLCIVLKNTKSLVLFEDYRLRIKNLIMIYRDMKSVVFDEHNLGLKNIKAMDVENKNADIIKKDNEIYKEQNTIYEENSSSSNNTCSSRNSYVNSDNIYKFIQSNCFENCMIKNKTNQNKITKTFDVYISKKLAIEIMNN
ncbi:phosphatidylinositol N-acetylglucosaminyltransferase subunit H, putative [Plasmodium berghei]|uniref:Phosphatidylinositol N-acetylglucosaminyltransferase subunit H, putative n=2 Tax=Plasmodium berghei TaxID=5821 RepID=A0A509APK2_PLABA|nr:phosphatidylinositol N-acetylglucosaminyltransferase subunit H, putative [Plasmodium berghei ANKA]SCM21820.1 phosphatidylinositol N-acetylglucosaminyltransferase subunit H, putative [Plasmodium berghei]SCN25070.1 phosphatidylinositol N-acetylglucosaminyltransferase subunit H, putative [Plasmodium berghei]SCO61623.1 phosphatidylinositol N-acetylglucosaminyltransferase subunit H, putative [Plasmodium berghei]VUC55617.1 phosphatidylinositol N-acetylglucosaminyltransferase subunit H, putative [P|eukprot:XP_034421427.1 phosphatidylinositol N-acetylglucosaminyltransferase subunit H, putative [Plasmodium berghei ANKA]